MEFIITKNDDYGAMLADRAFGGTVATLPRTDIVIPSASRRLTIRAFVRDIASHVEADHSLVLIGTHRVAPSTLQKELRSYRVAEDAYSIYRRIAGSFFTVLTWGREIHVFGTLSNTRRVVVNDSEGLVASDGDVVRRAIGLPIDYAHLSLLLLAMQPPTLLNDRLPWTGVRGVRHTDAVVLSEMGLSTVTRWTPPPAKVRLDIAASSLQAVPF